MSNEKIADNESVFDAQVRPLLDQIQKICIEHGIPMLANFQLTDGLQSPDNPRAGLMCAARVGVAGENRVFDVAATIMEHGGERVVVMKVDSDQLPNIMAQANVMGAAKPKPGQPN